jgi:hypothetical protein
LLFPKRVLLYKLIPIKLIKIQIALDLSQMVAQCVFIDFSFKMENAYQFQINVNNTIEKLENALVVIQVTRLEMEFVRILINSVNTRTHMENVSNAIKVII